MGVTAKTLNNVISGTHSGHEVSAEFGKSPQGHSADPEKAARSVQWIFQGTLVRMLYFLTLASHTPALPLMFAIMTSPILTPPVTICSFNLLSNTRCIALLCLHFTLSYGNTMDRRLLTESCSMERGYRSIKH